MCATILKNWREAATLILAHGRKKIQKPALKELYPSTVVPTEDLQQTTAEHDELQVLVLKRSSTSNFMPDLYVFPGGVADNADFSSSWLPLFGATAVDSAENRFAFSKAVSQNAPMFHRQRDPDFTSVPSEVAFRIKAIRETFEESGVLVARSIDQTDFQHNRNPANAYNFGENHESLVEEWRLRVMRNAGEFQTLCKHLDVVPDIWSLYDWSNWLTPHNLGGTPGGKRFDAAFYVCCLDEPPYVAEDASEAVHSQWLAPREILTNYLGKKVQLAPPQLYAACRLTNFSSLQALLDFLQGRIGQPLERWMPVRIQCADAIIYAFPGDSLYPDEPDVEGNYALLDTEETLQQLMHHSPNLHRAVAMVASDDTSTGVPRQFQLQCNIRELRYGQVAPCLE